MPEPATIADIQSIARSEALRSGKRILGITASTPSYVAVPDESDPNAVNEFVVDVQLLDGMSQAIILGLGGGLRLVQNVLIAHEAVGEIISTIQVPVEIELSITGQLQVVNRAKVALPFLQLDEYSYADLRLQHLSGYRVVDGVLQDPFCVPFSPGQQGRGGSTTVGVQVTTSTRLSTLGELDENDQGVVIGLGVNPWQRYIVSVIRAWTVSATDTLEMSESSEVT